jgi:hypothetical protein
MSDEDLTMASTGFVNEKARRNRHWWMTSFSKVRKQYSGTDLLNGVKLHTPHFINLCRMFPSNFDDKVNLNGRKIMRKDAISRKDIHLKERLAVTLRYRHKTAQQSKTIVAHIQSERRQMLTKHRPSCTAPLRV